MYCLLYSVYYIVYTHTRYFMPHAILMCHILYTIHYMCAYVHYRLYSIHHILHAIYDARCTVHRRRCSSKGMVAVSRASCTLDRLAQAVKVFMIKSNISHWWICWYPWACLKWIGAHLTMCMWSAFQFFSSASGSPSLHPLQAMWLWQRAMRIASRCIVHLICFLYCSLKGIAQLLPAVLGFFVVFWFLRFVSPYST